jgi:hypothetical protein
MIKVNSKLLMGILVVLNGIINGLNGFIVNNKIPLIPLLFTI